MAIKSGFFNSVNGDRKYDAKRFAEYFASFIGNGIFPNPSTNLQIISNNDMTVTVKRGRAWIDGYILINDDDYILAIDPADGVLNRIDKVVLRYDVADREIRLEVKKSAFASSPVPKELQRDADAHELGIADILVSKGAISITQANITDLRLNTEFCGIVHGTVDQVDLTTLYNQYTDGFKLKQEEFKQEFNTWFQTLQNALDENTAANLLNMINSNTDAINTISEDTNQAITSVNQRVTSHWADYEYQVPTITGNEIRLQKQSNTNILKFKIDTTLLGAISISIDGGNTTKPLVGVEGEPIVELEKGFVEVIADASFFTLRPKGGKKIEDIDHIISTQNEEFTIPKGQHSGSGVVRATFNNLIPLNIKQGVNVGGVVGSLVDYGLAVGTGILIESSTLLGSSSGTPTKVKEFRVGVKGTIRVYHALQHGGGVGSASSRIYINGVARGTIRTISSSTGTQLQTTEDLTVNANDLVQIYAWVSSANNNTSFIHTFRIQVDMSKVATMLLG